jgi:hypothetical protein
MSGLAAGGTTQGGGVTFTQCMVQSSPELIAGECHILVCVLPSAS